MAGTSHHHLSLSLSLERKQGRMPYMPPPHGYDQRAAAAAGPAPAAAAAPAGGRVEQRRNPDGSTSIQIGGGDGGSTGNEVKRGSSELPDTMQDNEKSGFGEEGGEPGKKQEGKDQNV